MPTSRWIAVAAASAAVLAAVVVPGSPAAASEHCTAYGSLPAKVSLHADHVVVHPVLTGSPGCLHRDPDNGATATLVVPKGEDEPMRWRSFGSSETIDLYASLSAPGTYRLSDGDVQVYDAQYRKVPFSWTNTTMVVKHSGRVYGIAAGGGRLTARAQFYGEDGWTAYAGVTVRAQRRAAGSSTWHTLGTVRAAANGRVSYRTALSSAYVYRLAFSTGTSTVWGAVSHELRG